MQTRTEALGYSVDEIITLSSIIEKEAKFSSDLSLISSVFHNRLNHAKKYPFLQSDATIAYAMQHMTGMRPSSKDIKIDYESPYNTYLHEGLTPGPISNPGYSAMAAALYPSQTGYYYFVSYDSGYTLYAETLADHQANVELVKNASD